MWKNVFTCSSCSGCFKWSPTHLKRILKNKTSQIFGLLYPPLQQKQNNGKSKVQTGIYILFVHKTVLRNVQFFLCNRSKKCFFLSLVILLIINTLKSTRTQTWAYTYSRLVSNYLGHFPFFEEIPKSEFLRNFFCSCSVLGHLKSKCYSWVVGMPPSHILQEKRISNSCQTSLVMFLSAHLFS